MKRSEITKQKIFDVAEIEFSEKGLYGARVDAIAQQAGINKRMIYQYYGSKEGLYTAVLHGVYERLADLEVHTLHEETDCKEAIRKVVFMYFRFLKDNPTFVKMIMWENLCNAAHFHEANVRNVKDPATAALRRLISRGKEEGVFRKDTDDDQLILSFHTFIFPYFSNIHTLSLLLDMELSSEQSMEERAEFIADTLLHMLTL